VLEVERCYAQLLAAGRAINPGDVLGCQTNLGFVRIEFRPNAVWRHGRAFYLCPVCGRRCGRMYVPKQGLTAKCRKCWGLAYPKQLDNYNKGFLAALVRRLLFRQG
jgi:hypothetical protein